MASRVVRRFVSRRPSFSHGGNKLSQDPKADESSFKELQLQNLKIEDKMTILQNESRKLKLDFQTSIDRFQASMDRFQASMDKESNNTRVLKLEIDKLESDIRVVRHPISMKWLHIVSRVAIVSNVLGWIYTLDSLTARNKRS